MGTCERGANARDYLRFRLKTHSCALQFAFAEIGVPEKTSGHGSPWTPGLAEGFEFLGRRALAEALHFLHRSSERKVADGPDIRAAKGTQQINVRGPAANSFEGDEHLVRGLVRKLVKVAQIEVTACERFREQARIERFLAAEANPQQFHVIQLQESLGSKRLHGSLETIEGS